MANSSEWTPACRGIQYYRNSDACCFASSWAIQCEFMDSNGIRCSAATHTMIIVYFRRTLLRTLHNIACTVFIRSPGVLVFVLTIIVGCRYNLISSCVVAGEYRDLNLANLQHLTSSLVMWLSCHEGSILPYCEKP